MARLIASAKAGRLTERGDAGAYEGAWHELLRGMNDTLDAIVRPLAEASSVPRRAASRDVTARMVEAYAGDMAEFKTTLNAAVTRKNAEHANAARGLNEAVGMRELGEAMRRIEASSSAIASIVHAMDDVATQRSAEAAQSTARLIEEARKHAEAGVAIASQVTGVMDEMAKASDRQREGVERIRVAMEQVNHATQNVAASSEESAAAAEELQSSGGGDAIACQLIPTEWTRRARVAS